MTNRFAFTIRGNPKNLEGNPFPCSESIKKMPQQPNSDRWDHWFDYVRSIFWLKYRSWEWCCDNYPFTTSQSQKAKMYIKIYWSNGYDSDPLKIYECIASAFFKNYEHLDGYFESQYAPDGKGRVEVDITLNN
jgi:hypothetical protein